MFPSGSEAEEAYRALQKKAEEAGHVVTLQNDLDRVRNAYMGKDFEA